MVVVTDDRGAAAVWSLALVVTLVGVAAVIAMLGGVAVSRARAAAVADLAAVAGARQGSCDHARAVVKTNDMRMEACSVVDGDVLVRVAAPTPPAARRIAALLGGDVSDVRADARAGFVESFDGVGRGYSSAG
jgi:secretion/DNA translocation related TadE-like protein